MDTTLSEAPNMLSYRPVLTPAFIAGVFLCLIPDTAHDQGNHQQGR
jgi:hypothetical protein